MDAIILSVTLRRIQSSSKLGHQIKLAELITVINNRINISKYVGVPSGKPLEVAGPVYTKDEILELTKNAKAEFWQTSSRHDAQDYKLTEIKLCDLIAEAISNGYYHKSEWCEKSGSRKTGKEVWVVADSYTVTVKEINPTTGQIYDAEWFLKFAIGKGGSILSVSNHAPREKTK